MNTAAHYRDVFRPGNGTLEVALWVVVVASLLGDMVTTFVGLRLGLAETNPIALAAIENWGVIGMIVLKVFAIAVGVVCRPLIPQEYRCIIPAGLAIPWTIAVAINLYMISLAI